MMRLASDANIWKEKTNISLIWQAQQLIIWLQLNRSFVNSTGSVSVEINKNPKYY